MATLTTIIAVLVGLLTIADLVLRNANYIERLRFLVAPLFPINLLELIIVFLFLVLTYGFYSNRFWRYLSYRRARRFYENWKNFKDILRRYKETSDISFQESYLRLRDKLEKDIYFFNTSMRSIQDAQHRRDVGVVMENFEKCFSPRNIEAWADVVRRGIAEELDCFDYLLVSLVEDFKKPERPYEKGGH